MTIDQLTKERAFLTDRINFIDAVIASKTKKRTVDAPYGCQHYDAERLCRFDRRAISRKCDGCSRVTDRAYLETMGLWVNGVSHLGEVK
jgi:hypothetical protein